MKVWISSLLLAALVVFAGCDKFNLTGDSKAKGHSRPWNFRIEKIHAPASARIDTFFEKRHKSGRFNGVVLFAEDGKVIYEKALGYANFDSRQPLEENSVFQLASVSKQFTAFAIMLLKERGQLSYEDTLGTYFRGFPFGSITIRQLLTHNSGLPNYMYFVEEHWPNKKLPLKNSDVLWVMKTFRPHIYFNPGQRYNYSNTGYSLLASVVEKVSRMSFPQFMRQEVFIPLGMKNTFVITSAGFPELSNLALGHRPNNRLEAWSYQDGVVGDKGVYSCVEDLFRWDQSLYNSPLISKETLDEAFMPAYKNRSEEHNYGFGFRISRDSLHGRIIYHGGWWKGYRTYLVRAVDEHRTVIVLTNTSAHPSFRIKELLDLF